MLLLLVAEVLPTAPTVVRLHQAQVIREVAFSEVRDHQVAVSLY